MQLENLKIHGENLKILKMRSNKSEKLLMKVCERVWIEKLIKICRFWYALSLPMRRLETRIFRSIKGLRLWRSRQTSLIDRKIRGSILLMGKLNAYQKRQILISFSIQTISHTFINNLNCRSLANKNAFSILSLKNSSLFYDVVASDGIRTQVVPIHVHNENARNATTTIQAAIKVICSWAVYSFNNSTTISIPRKTYNFSLIIICNFFYPFFIYSQLIETFHMWK